MQCNGKNCCQKPETRRQGTPCRWSILTQSFIEAVAAGYSTGASVHEDAHLVGGRQAWLHGGAPCTRQPGRHAGQRPAVALQGQPFSGIGGHGFQPAAQRQAAVLIIATSAALLVAYGLFSAAAAMPAAGSAGAGAGRRHRHLMRPCAQRRGGGLHPYCSCVLLCSILQISAFAWAWHCGCW